MSVTMNYQTSKMSFFLPPPPQHYDPDVPMAYMACYPLLFLGPAHYHDYVRDLLVSNLLSLLLSYSSYKQGLTDLTYQERGLASRRAEAAASITIEPPPITIDELTAKMAALKLGGGSMVTTTTTTTPTMTTTSTTTTATSLSPPPPPTMTAEELAATLETITTKMASLSLAVVVAEAPTTNGDPSAGDITPAGEEVSRVDAAVEEESGAEVETAGVLAGAPTSRSHLFVPSDFAAAFATVPREGAVIDGVYHFRGNAQPPSSDVVGGGSGGEEQQQQQEQEEEDGSAALSGADEAEVEVEAEGEADPEVEAETEAEAGNAARRGGSGGRRARRRRARRGGRGGRHGGRRRRR